MDWSRESITGGFTSVVRNVDDGTRVMLTNGKFQLLDFSAGVGRRRRP